jgi:macrolide transport system ATP-binding/permease protein
MLMLQCKNVKKDFGIHEVLKAVNLDLEEGERVGLVGKNGAGKTTLANILYGTLKPDDGQVSWHRRDVQIGYLRQSVFYTSSILHGLYQDQDVSAQLQDFLHTASELGTEKVYEWEDERFAALSGGEKTKLALAQIWSTKPDLLILDEPTNHLDFKGVQWLIDELAGYPGTILVISHNRYFLDQAVNRILEVENGMINEYRGNYTFYRNEKRKRYEDQLHAYEVQEKYKEMLDAEIRQLKDWSGKAHRDSTKKGASSGLKMGLKEFYRAKAKKTDKKVKSTIKRLEKLKTEGIQRPEDEFQVAFSFDDAEKRSKKVLEASNIRKRFGDRVLFRESSFYLQRGERMGIFGENGCGKTTLVKAILGQEPIDGTLNVSPSANIGYMSQDVLDLDSKGTALDLFDMPNHKEQGRIRTMLANLGFDERLLMKPLQSMSLGERTKLKLANLIIRGYDVLILDEPTNHLDLHAREQLEDALEAYDGTILLVTHDRYMLDRICDKLLVFENSKIKRVEYGLEEYLKRLEQPETIKTKKDAMSEEEERMVLENRITTVLGKLSQLKPEAPEYIALDAEFKELISKRNKR